MIFPKKIIFGESAIAQIKTDEIPRLTGSNVLLIVSETLHFGKMDTWLIDVFRSCKSHIDVHTFSKEPWIADVDDLIRKYQDTAYDLIIGFGGGSVMDLAKAVSLCLSNKTKCSYLLKLPFAGKRKIELWLVPSTAGTGSEVNNLAIINTSGGKQAIVNMALLPDLVILNPDVLNSLSKSTKLLSLIDTLSHALESLTAKRNTTLTEFYSVGALNLIAKYHQQYLSGANNSINSHFQLASLSAGLAFGETGVHLVHAFAYALVEQIPLKHSHSIAIVLPSILAYWVAEKSNQLTKIKEYVTLVKQLTDLLDNYREKIYNNVRNNITDKQLLIRKVLANQRLLNNSYIKYKERELFGIADDIYDRIKSSKSTISH